MPHINSCTLKHTLLRITCSPSQLHEFSKLRSPSSPKTAPRPSKASQNRPKSHKTVPTWALGVQDRPKIAQSEKDRKRQRERERDSQTDRQTDSIASQWQVPMSHAYLYCISVFFIMRICQVMMTELSGVYEVDDFASLCKPLRVQ